MVKIVVDFEEKMVHDSSLYEENLSIRRGGRFNFMTTSELKRNEFYATFEW